MNIDLTPNERKLIESFEKRFSKNAKYAITLENLLSRWYQLANDLKAGSSYTNLENDIYDYTNELGVRTLIGEVFDGVSFEIKNKIKIILDPVDEKFKETTVEDVKGIITKGAGKNDCWWRARIPKSWESKMGYYNNKQ